MKWGQLMFTCSRSLCNILWMEYSTTDQCFPTHLLLQMLLPAVTTRQRHSLYCSTVNRESVLQQAGRRCTRQIRTLLKCPWARYWTLTSFGGVQLCTALNDILITPWGEKTLKSNLALLFWTVIQWLLSVVITLEKCDDGVLYKNYAAGVKQGRAQLFHPAGLLW